MMYQKLAQREKFLFIFGPFKNFFRNSNKVEVGFDKDSKTEERNCFMCGQGSSDCVLKPCGHTGICRFCASDLKKQGKKCIICLEDILEVEIPNHDNE